MYFIKVKQSLEDTRHHIINMLRIVKKPPKHVQDIVTFMSEQVPSMHTMEMSWYAFLANTDTKDRTFAVDQIVQLIRKYEYRDMSVRPRKTP